MRNQLSGLTTETKNKQSEDLDLLSTFDIVRLMNEEDKKVAYCVEKELPAIARAIDMIAECLQNGGRLFYFGAGTSGRLGLLDAAECPPTFGTDPALVQGVIAGGVEAVVKAIEGAEDLAHLGQEDVVAHGVREGDAVVGIAASGRTPYVKGALEEAGRLKAKIISLSCNPAAEINEGVDASINVVVGPEVVTGSTRLKAATAQKMVLNMITTTCMVRLGKVYKNLMVNVQITNEKLKERAKQIVAEAAQVPPEEAEQLLAQANGDAKLAIVMKKTALAREESVRLLEQYKGNIRPIMEGHVSR
ncbi:MULTISPECIES: N-acetylmuramic acid 6-phosphate etherase [Brevibacillus]|jgi:N-acetylmuramic acid 6-phosphate etherase|uniref:N-acetylmuramic acid 6-phosphate etherase n=1 Tax=Brevibacillus parabrevis TaxID=54914 RepID=A0A4Y3PRV9_BREPA|nr:MULTISPECIES: N-acetylmuramic acid 6-phosphate etherase [Brevibacillus]MBU8714136.1 N-acetylmuramic acid 6-phosphate etherase [Brevibacillus parabrevis]MDH6350413.1 N-acetylmuramic acid 6-phosphate etherase [Brevibacillus sp. 1238]MDR4998534.1 N-acetylmuramic acid 6-phosphate etherase [Brevibacillus parabrevis]MED2258404.1 N-acetylmuramic acid 6-phosphate etherase [Brevibacillus parabrevis]NRQ55722.1 N-acetylmuramic acid 6-phosphate etherase [Brevibacillus sp. HD1.4A]